MRISRQRNGSRSLKSRTSKTSSNSTSILHVQLLRRRCDLAYCIHHLSSLLYSIRHEEKASPCSTRHLLCCPAQSTGVSDHDGHLLLRIDPRCHAAVTRSSTATRTGPSPCAQKLVRDTPLRDPAFFSARIAIGARWHRCPSATRRKRKARAGATPSSRLVPVPGAKARRRADVRAVEVHPLCAVRVWKIAVAVCARGNSDGRRSACDHIFRCQSPIKNSLQRCYLENLKLD